MWSTTGLHEIVPLAHAHAPDGESVEGDGRDVLGTFGPEFRIDASLDDSE